MPIPNNEQIEAALEEIRNTPIPENITVFSIDINERGDKAYGVYISIDPFAHTTPEGGDYHLSQSLPFFDFQFPSEREALDYAKKVHDILIEKGMGPGGPTAYLIESAQ